MAERSSTPLAIPLGLAAQNDLARTRAQVDVKQLKRLTKDFYRLVAVDVKGEELQAAQESFLLDLDQLVLQLSKTTRLQKVAENEVVSYETEAQAIESQQNETMEKIAGLRLKLESAELTRARRIEYDAKAKIIGKLPDRIVGAETIAKLNEDAVTLRQEQETYKGTWKIRQDAFDEIVGKLTNMSEAIAEEKNEQERRRQLDDDNQDGDADEASPGGGAPGTTLDPTAPAFEPGGGAGEKDEAMGEEDGAEGKGESGDVEMKGVELEEGQEREEKEEGEMELNYSAIMSGQGSSVYKPKKKEKGNTAQVLAPTPEQYGGPSTPQLDHAGMEQLHVPPEMSSHVLASFHTLTLIHFLQGTHDVTGAPARFTPSPYDWAFADWANEASRNGNWFMYLKELLSYHRTFQITNYPSRVETPTMPEVTLDTWSLWAAAYKKATGQALPASRVIAYIKHFRDFDGCLRLVDDRKLRVLRAYVNLGHRESTQLPALDRFTELEYLDLSCDFGCNWTPLNFANALRRVQLETPVLPLKTIALQFRQWFRDTTMAFIISLAARSPRTSSFHLEVGHSYGGSLDGGMDRFEGFSMLLRYIGTRKSTITSFTLSITSLYTRREEPAAVQAVQDVVALISNLRELRSLSVPPGNFIVPHINFQRLPHLKNIYIQLCDDPKRQQTVSTQHISELVYGVLTTSPSIENIVVLLVNHWRLEDEQSQADLLFENGAVENYVRAQLLGWLQYHPRRSREVGLEVTVRWKGLNGKESGDEVGRGYWLWALDRYKAPRTFQWW
ncbi:Tho complex subunit 7-like protein [Pseudohyphozyma bogoriensis]|nr:Tho complex subunit 7-like protein [Pseudohyphozyma bogoriensis]